MEYGDITKKNGDSMGLDRTLMGYNGYGYISAYNQNWTPNYMISGTKTYWKNIPKSWGCPVDHDGWLYFFC